MRVEEFILKKKGNAFFFLDEETGIIGEGKNINNAYADLIKKKESYQKLKKISGINTDFIFKSIKNNKNLSFTKKWIISFIFIAISSVPLSYSISNGIKNGLNNIDIPKGNLVWKMIGDEIIKISKSDTVQDTSREQEIKEALSILKERIKPYKDFFAE